MRAGGLGPERSLRERKASGGKLDEILVTFIQGELGPNEVTEMEFSRRSGFMVTVSPYKP